jgi:hypothetical protein
VSDPGPAHEPAGDEVDWDSLAFDPSGELRDLSNTQRVFWGPPPPAPAPVHVTEPESVIGRRLILVQERGPVYDLCAASEVWTDGSGSWIKIVEDWRWHTWANTPAYRDRTPQCPRAVAHPTVNVWVER